MKKIIPFLVIIAAVFSFTVIAGAQTTITPYEAKPGEIDRIIKRMAENEDEFRQALTEYVFTRKAKIETVGLGGQITGTYRRDSFMTFTQDGKRFERILYAPVSTIKAIRITPEDIDDLGGINPFAIKPTDIDLYNFTLLGKEKIDELNLYVFEVAPKVMPDPRKSDLRLFQGRIWIDDIDLMIVKSRGKAVPEGKNKQGIDQRFPIVETWRNSVDNKYYFPVYSSADDELVFGNGSVIRMKMLVRYSDYAQGRTSVKVLDDDQPVDENQPPPLPKTKP